MPLASFGPRAIININTHVSLCDHAMLINKSCRAGGLTSAFNMYGKLEKWEYMRSYYG
jgi:hypothetical protein